MLVMLDIAHAHAHSRCQLMLDIGPLSSVDHDTPIADVIARVDLGSELTSL